MSLYPQLRFMSTDKVPNLAIGILVVIAILSLYLVGYDQGQFFSLVQGTEALDTMWLHEFTHDVRHASGFPCH